MYLHTKRTRVEEYFDNTKQEENISQFVMGGPEEEYNKCET